MKLPMLAFSASLIFAPILPLTADETPLSEQMSELSGALKGLRKAKTTEEKVKLVQTAQKATLESAKYEPAVFKAISDDMEKARAWADYKRLIGVSYTQLCELELAYLAGDEEAAAKLVRSLKQVKKEAHRKYTED